MDKYTVTVCPSFCRAHFLDVHLHERLCSADRFETREEANKFIEQKIKTNPYGTAEIMTDGDKLIDRKEWNHMKTAVDKYYSCVLPRPPRT